MVLISIICAAFTGRMGALSDGVLKGAGEAVNLVISLLGMMAFWTGIMKIAEKSGFTEFLAKVFSPALKFLFPEIPEKSNSLRYICMNITANLLGLGNAATPFGILAVKEMKKLSKNDSSATNGMIMFLVINTASLQLIPTLLMVIRQKYGSSSPLGILPHIWLSSILGLVFGVITTKIFEKRESGL